MYEAKKYHEYDTTAEFILSHRNIKCIVITCQLLPAYVTKHTTVWYCHQGPLDTKVGGAIGLFFKSGGLNKKPCFGSVCISFEKAYLTVAFFVESAACKLSVCSQPSMSPDTEFSKLEKMFDRVATPYTDSVDYARLPVFAFQA